MARTIPLEDAKARLMGRRIVCELSLSGDERRAALAELEAIIHSNATNPLAAWFRQTRFPVVRVALVRYFSREMEEARAGTGREGVMNTCPALIIAKQNAT